jgi:pimeloyl-ACP methyl ester carboxylesterase
MPSIWRILLNLPISIFNFLRLALVSWVVLFSFIQTTGPGLAATSEKTPFFGQPLHVEQTPSAHTALVQTTGFEPAACMFNVPTGFEVGKDVICGYVSVPEDHNNPASRTIRLAVVVYKSKDPNPKPDPLFLAQGGPGGSTIDTYAEPIPRSNLLTDRDIVLFDQRGTLKSDPVLYCDEYDKLVATLIEKDLTFEQYDPLEQQALQACHQRLVNEGINLSDYDSLQNAADVEAVRQALGYGQINLYGVSYGTLLALHTLGMYPTSLRSVILDGVVPPQVNFNLLGAQTENRDFTRLFDACRQDIVCNREYPDLENVFFDLVDKLDKQPAVVKMTDTTTGAVYNHAVIDGETFLSGIFQILYSGELLPSIPRMIYDARDGNFDVFARILSILVFDHTMAYGMYYSVICAEDADFTLSEQPLDGVRPYIVTMEKQGLTSLLETCKTWNVTPIGAVADKPVTSDVPVLLLSGYFDPVTPADFAAQAAATLPHSYSFVFPAGGHGQMLSDDCANHIILSFLEDPTKAPDAACLQKESGPAFFTSKTIIDLPVLLPLLNLDPKATVQFGLLVACLLILGSSYMVYPIAWLVGKAGKTRPRPSVDYGTITGVTPGGFGADLQPPTSAISYPDRRAPFLARSFSWMTALASLLLGIFLIAFVVVSFQMAFDNDNRLFYGLGSENRPWFFLLPMFALLTLGMIIGAIQAWARRYGSNSRRLYNTLLVLAAIGALVILGVWGALTNWLPF